MPELYYAADVCVFPSIREGQGLAAIEGMACGLPLIVSDNRGTRGFIMDHENALVVKSDDVTGFAEAIKELKDNPELQKKMGENNRVKCAEFDVNRINNQMKEIYQSV